MNKDVIILGEIHITPLIKAHQQLKRGLAGATTELERDGVIQRFEFTYELAWKTLKKILAYQGITVDSPRETFREAAKLKLIDNVNTWFTFIKKRNLTSHVYNETYAKEVFDSVPRFDEEVEKLIATITTL